MASSVERRIEDTLRRVKGHHDPAGLIRPRSTVPIKACGYPAAQPGRTHDRKRPFRCHSHKTLARRGPSTHDPAIQLFLHHLLDGRLGAGHEGYKNRQQGRAPLTAYCLLPSA
jgi:hypothetical protein